MYWQIMGRSKDREEIIGRGLNTLQIGECLLTRAHLWDEFVITLDVTFTERFGVEEYDRA